MKMMLDQGRRAELAEELGDDFLDELTSTFWEDAWALLDQGIAAIVSNDTVELGKIVHTLHGSAGNLGFPCIAEAAADAQTALNAGERLDFGRLQAVMLRTLAALDADDGGRNAEVQAISA